MAEVAFELLSELSLVEPDPPSVRSTCSTCLRPTITCWCQFLPTERLSVNTQVYILQHPYEETRSLRTAIMLSLALQPGQCHTFKGKRFSEKRFPLLHAVAEDERSLLLYPGPTASDLDTLISQSAAGRAGTPSYNLIVLDGTWLQARGIYWQNPFLHSIKQIQLSHTGPSQYVVRTQPTEASLSTLETVAVTISLLENRPEIYQQLIRPLQALCSYQLERGAVAHQSKQFLREHGLYKKQLNPHGRTAAQRQCARRRRGRVRTGAGGYDAQENRTADVVTTES